jgi:hypothetical protein
VGQIYAHLVRLRTLLDYLLFSHFMAGITDMFFGSIDTESLIGNLVLASVHRKKNEMAKNNPQGCQRHF